MKNRDLTLILAIAFLALAGIALGVFMTVRKGEITPVRDAAQSEAHTQSEAQDAAQDRLNRLKEEVASSDSAGDTEALTDAVAEKDARAEEVALLQEALDRALDEVQKQSNIIDTRRETLSERDNMVATYDAERRELTEVLEGLLEQANDGSSPTEDPSSEEFTTPAPEDLIIISPTEPPELGAVVARVGEREITSEQLKTSFEQYLPQYAEDYDLSDEAAVKTLLLEELNYLVELAILTEWAEELGITGDASNFAKDAESLYNALLDQRTASLMAAETVTEEEAREEATAYFERHHYTKDQLARIMADEDIHDRVRSHFAELATPTEEDLKAEYDRRVESARLLYQQTPESFELDIVKADPVFYYPAGYRVVRHVFLLFTAEEQLEVSQLLLEKSELDADDEERAANIEKRIEDLCAPLEERVALVQEQLSAGVDFKELIETMGEDPGMTVGATAERGYYVSAESTVFDEYFRDGAMGIEEVGSYSQPIVSGFGIHIIHYERDAEEGPADYESVREQLRESYITNRMENEYQRAREVWLKAHPVEKYPELIGAELPFDEFSDLLGEVLQ